MTSTMYGTEESSGGSFLYSACWCTTGSSAGARSHKTSTYWQKRHANPHCLWVVMTSLCVCPSHVSQTQGAAGQPAPPPSRDGVTSRGTLRHCGYSPVTMTRKQGRPRRGSLQDSPPASRGLRGNPEETGELVTATCTSAESSAT